MNKYTPEEWERICKHSLMLLVTLEDVLRDYENCPIDGDAGKVWRENVKKARAVIAMAKGEGGQPR